MALKSTTFVSNVFDKIFVKFHRFIMHFKEVKENVLISEQPSYIALHHILVWLLEAVYRFVADVVIPYTLYL
jgi:hypothetical protein